ncbi:MAG: DUF4214 domain-containing protein [Actinomycetota bacterium]
MGWVIGPIAPVMVATPVPALAESGPPPTRPSGDRRRDRSRWSLLLAALVVVTALVVLGLATPRAAAVSGPINSANASFIADSYTQFLGRSADDAGLDYHLGVLSAGGDQRRLTFTYALLFSAEGAGIEVDRAYQDLLNRAAEADGRAFWASRLQGHGVSDLRVLLLASDEYVANAGGTESAWIDALYADVVDRPADDDGKQYWLDQRAAGVARANVAAGLYFSDEALGRRVDAYYTELLSRAPAAGERTAGIAQIRATGERSLRAAVWASDEAYETYLQAAWS